MKDLKELFGDFYSPLHALSYNRPWIISVGSRSIGKSTGWLILVIWDYLRYGHRFIYIRRSDKEVRAVCASVCDSAWFILRDAGYPVYEITAKKGKFWLKREKGGRKEEIGMYFGLNLSYQYKSSNFGANQYNTIIYDEFINIDSTKYLGTAHNITYEYDRCLELYQTVDRGVGKPFRNETRFIFLANLATYFNPIFLGLGIDRYIRTDSKNIAPQGKLWICEQIKGVKATEQLKDAYGYQLADESNRNYAYQNIAFDEKQNLVEVIKAPTMAVCNVQYCGHLMGVYRTLDAAQTIYICERRNDLMTMALTADDMGRANFSTLRAPASRMYIDIIKAQFNVGNVRFQNRKCRYEICNYMLSIPV